jgi:hypothetical protein
MKSVTPLARASLPLPLILDPVTPSTPGLKGFEGLLSTDRAAREEILHRAHSIWEAAGRPDNRALENWLAAEAEVLGDSK